MNEISEYLEALEDCLRRVGETCNPYLSEIFGALLIVCLSIGAAHLVVWFLRIFNIG